ncbi:MAG: 1-acyl-sn-glycerol-3-phosphate acyltransferase [Microscillaceae bacterium]|nr:1-acyl-sn-glycerol-3-phosphate acyltransferase [Microscillaceae bacterium]
MLYPILKLIAHIALKVFFKSLKIKHKALIPQRGPLIVVANHPNTFMDPILIAALLRPQVYFIANSSVFATPFLKWLFRQLHMIPIQRKTDKVKIDNKEIFQKCYDFLAGGGTLLIFPEGTSIRARRLQELKSGTARIALGAESQNDFQLGLKIVTLGLNYSKPESFRSEVFVNVDEPIVVKDFQEAYETDSFAAANQLTEVMREKLEKHIIITHTEEEDRLTKQIETVYKSKLNEEIQLSDEPKEQDFLMTKGIVDAVQHFQEQDPQRIQRFSPKIERYLRNLDRLNLSDEVFARKSPQNGIFRASLQTAFYFVLGFPLFLYGLINNYIPYIIPSKVASKVVQWSKAEEYTAPVMMITGIFSFSFFYIVQLIAVQWIFQNWWLTLFYFISLPISGFFALFYANYLHDTQDKWRLFALFYKRTDLVATLVQQRKEIIRELEKAKEDYLGFYAGKE